MDLNNILYSPNAANIQVVVNADELRKCFENFTEWGMQRIKERDEPTYYTREELQELFHVTAPTIMNWRKKGILPEPAIVAGRVLYDKAKVRDAVLNGNAKLKLKYNLKTVKP